LAFEQTWRWFGPNDPFSLKEIRQAGATGIVTALHHIPPGEPWSEEEILKRKRMIESEGMVWSVTESIPVHENIKRRERDYQRMIESYKDTIRNLGRCGIDTVCYNFMPVLDWLRTDLRVIFRDGSITTRFESKALAAFDLFLLRRPHAEDDYTEEQAWKAKSFYDGMDEAGKKNLVDTVLLGLPGSLEAYSLDGLRAAIGMYHDIDENALRESLMSFLKEIIPAAEEAGVLMAIHPDDPPWPLLGLPRVVSSQADADRIVRAVDSPANGLTFCTGSYGAAVKNDLVEMARSFAHRVNFIHLRNVSRNSDGDFLEENHLEGDIDIYNIMKTFLIEQKKRISDGRKDFRMPMRPDHGHLMLPDQSRKGIYPGYSLFGRMRGLAELRGLELGISRSLHG